MVLSQQSPDEIGSVLVQGKFLSFHAEEYRGNLVRCEGFFFAVGPEKACLSLKEL